MKTLMTIYKLQIENEFEDEPTETFYTTKEKAITALEDKVGKEELDRNGVKDDGDSTVVYYHRETSFEGYTYFAVEAVEVK